jgi:signal transduction histidine kinase
VRVSVSDNGKGLGERGEGESARFGLMGMRERVQALNGEFHLESKPGAGLQVTALIPVPAQIPDGVETERKGADMKAIAR